MSQNWPIILSHFFRLYFFQSICQSPCFCSGSGMKEWIVIHQIKALYNHGNGLSARQIAKQWGIFRNTVSKYLKRHNLRLRSCCPKRTGSRSWTIPRLHCAVAANLSGPVGRESAAQVEGQSRRLGRHSRSPGTTAKPGRSP
jgi:hypothetical protein